MAASLLPFLKIDGFFFAKTASIPDVYETFAHKPFDIVCLYVIMIRMARALSLS